MPGFVASIDTSLTVPIRLTHLYYICFLAGFAISATIFCILHWVFPAKDVVNFVASISSPKLLMAEYQDQWDVGDSEITEDVSKNAYVVDREVA
jgi:NCS1 family nucleobase:cation symporter-1